MESLWYPPGLLAVAASDPADRSQCSAYGSSVNEVRPSKDRLDRRRLPRPFWLPGWGSATSVRATWDPHISAEACS